MSTNKQNKFIIIGGAGYLGRFLVKELINKYPDYDIEIVTRNLSKAIFFDSDNVNLKKSIRDVDLNNAVLFNLAFDQGVGFKDTRQKAETLIEDIKFALNKGTIKKLIHVSSIVVQGKVLSKAKIKPKPLHKVSKDDPYCYAKGLVEKALYRLGDSIQTPIIIVRSGNIMGPGSIWAQKLIIRLIEGAPITAKGKTYPSNTTFVGNIAWALAQLASTNIQLPNKVSVMNFAEFGNVTWEEWVKLLANSEGLSPKTWKHNKLEAYKPSIKRDVKQIIDDIIKNAVPALAKGSATNKYVIKLADLGNAAEVKQKAKRMVSNTGKERPLCIDMQEYSMAIIYLNKTAFGTECVPESIVSNLPYSKEKVVSAICNWIDFASYR